MYSNEHLRNSQLTLESQKNPEYEELLEELADIDDELSDITIQHNRLIDEKYLLIAEIGIPLESEGEQYPNVH